MMDIDFLDAVGWRDVILVVAAMVGIYLALLVLRLFRVSGKRTAQPDKVARRWFSGREPALQQVGQDSPAVAELGFSHELARTSVEVELERLRRECVQLREELARVAEEVTRLKANRSVSPLYNEATALAQQGMPAAGIAGHCGISIGEAELVAALARGGSDFGRHEQGEDRDERNTGSR